MNGTILFYDVANQDYMPLVKMVATSGKSIILNESVVRQKLLQLSIPLQKWESFIPNGVQEFAQKEVVKIANGLNNTLLQKKNTRIFQSSFGDFLPAVRKEFFSHAINMFFNQIMTIETLDNIIKSSKLELIVMGCDNSHVQRSIVNYARVKDIPTLQLAHGIYGTQLVRRAGEMENLFSDFIAVFGDKAHDIIVEMGVELQRIFITGAPLWDSLYEVKNRMDQFAARKKLNLDNNKPVILFCSNYADSSSAFFPAFVKRFEQIHKILAKAIGKMENDVQLIIRPHPMEFKRVNLTNEQKIYAEQAYLKWIIDQGLNNVQIIRDHKIESILAADAVIAIGSSSVIPEAMILQRPVVVLKRLSQEKLVYTEKDGVCVIENEAKLGNTLQKLVTNSKMQEEIVQQQNTALPAINVANDGDACKRTANLITKLCSNSIKRWQQKKELNKENSVPSHKRDRLKVLEIVHNFPPFQYGGTELYTLNLSKELQKAGHEVTVLHPIFDKNKSSFHFEIGSFEDLPVIRFNVYSPSKSVYSDYFNPEFDAPFNKFLQSNQFDIVHFQHIYGLSANWISIVKQLGLKVVLKLDDLFFYCKQVHLNKTDGSYCADGPESLDKCFSCNYGNQSITDPDTIANAYHSLAHRRALLQKVFSIPDFIHTPSHFVRDTYRKFGFDNYNFHVIPTGISPFDKRDKVTDEKNIRIAFVGAIDRRKGIRDFIKAVEIYEAKKETQITTNLKFEIYGNPNQNDLFQVVSQKVNEISNLEYKGGFSHKERATIFSQIDVLVLPSLGENYPFILREALYAGIPVIATNIAGTPEIVEDGRNGFLFEPGDYAELASIFQRISQNPGLLSQLNPDKIQIKTIVNETEELSQKFKELFDSTDTEQQTPLVSIVMVTYNSESTIVDCLSSIHKNTKIPYEILIVDNDSRQYIQEFVTKEIEFQIPITFIKNKTNLGFSAATNQGIRAAKGDYIVLLNPDTIVTPNWLTHLIHHFSDSVGAVGPISNYAAAKQNFYPYIDKAWRGNFSYDEMGNKVYQRNRGKSVESKLLIGFCMMVKKDVFEKIGLLDEKLFLGNDDLDFSLRLRQAGYKLLVATDTFIYHKGQVSFQSEAESTTTKLVQESTNYLFHKLEAQFGQNNVPSPQELWGIDWFKPSEAKFGQTDDRENHELVSIIILTYNALEHTKKCIASIQKHTQLPHEVIIVDNGSTDGTIDYLKNLAKENDRYSFILNQKNKGFAAGNNQGIKKAKGKYVILLNSDTIVTPEWLEGLLRAAELSQQIGIVGPRTNNSCESIQVEQQANYQDEISLNRFAQQLATKNRNKYTTSVGLTAFCFLIKREVIEKVGLLDEAYGLGNFEDNDYCVRARLAGFETLVAEDVYIHHEGNSTFKENKIDYSELIKKNLEYFKQKWKDEIEFRGKRYYLKQDLEKFAREEIENGEQEFQKQDLEKAKQHFEKALEWQPENAIAMNNLGVIYWQQQQVEKARSYFQKSLNIDSNNQDSLNNLLDLAVTQQDVDQIQQTIKDAHKNENWLPVLYRLGDLNLQYDAPQQALQNFSQMKKIDPNRAEAYIGIARVEWKNGNFKEAMNYLEQAAEIEPQNRELNLHQALFAFQLGQQENAIVLLQEYLKNNEDGEIRLVLNQMTAKTKNELVISE